MKMFLISDNVDTLVGLRMVGVDGVVVHTSREVKQAFEKAIADESIGLVLFTAKLVAENRELVFQHKLNTPSPLVAEIPDRHGGNNVADGIKQYIAEVAGIKL